MDQDGVDGSVSAENPSTPSSLPIPPTAPPGKTSECNIVIDNRKLLYLHQYIPKTFFKLN